VHQGTTGFVLDRGDAYAVYWADWFPHSSEMIVNVVMGEFGYLASYDDNVLFGIRYGRVDQEASPAASLIQPTIDDARMRARPLDRDGALEHPWLADLWEVSDWLVENDPLLHEHVFHMPEGAG